MERSYLTLEELLLLGILRRPSLKEKDVIWVSGKFCVNSLPCISQYSLIDLSLCHDIYVHARGDNAASPLFPNIQLPILSLSL